MYIEVYGNLDVVEILLVPDCTCSCDCLVVLRLWLTVEVMTGVSHPNHIIPGQA